MSKIVRIGNSSGFWGDDPYALQRQLMSGNLDYVNSDYLAEVSMSILRKQQNRNPELGYVTDFIDHMLIAKEELKNSTTRIVTNAGGNNPLNCAHALSRVLEENGIFKSIFAISGDNILEDLNQLYHSGCDFENLEDGKSFAEIKRVVQSANVYTGSVPIVEALKAGADIVIAGRVSDSALTIGPLMYEFNWDEDDWNRLSAAMIAGHIIECGSQSTGGNFTDWKEITDWGNMAFPIVEVEESGDFVVTKNSKNGGLVNSFTVREQLVYEIADPTNYYGPDVIADISSVQVSDIGENRVSVTGAKGKHAPSTWKVSMAYHHGWKSSGSLIISGPGAALKAEKFKEIFWKRLNTNFEKTATNFIGMNAVHADLVKEIDPNELMIQFVAFDTDPANLDKFSKQISAMILSGPQGVAVTGGRPKIQEVLRYWPALIPKELVKSTVYSIDKKESTKIGEFTTQSIKSEIRDNPLLPSDAELKNAQSEYDHVNVKLLELCLARSGDKGNSVNMGVIARSAEIYTWMKNNLTAVLIKKWFSALCDGEVLRYELDNLNALNFVLKEALDGGGTYSGRIDTQGKMFASLLLDIEVEVPGGLLVMKD